MAHTPGAPAIPGGLSGESSTPARNGRVPGRGAQGAATLDHLSKQIIEQLQEDGRRSYAAIGKAVGLSEAAVRQRVQRLVDAGVMQIVAVTDPLMLGFRRQTMIGIKCEGNLGQVADHLAELDRAEIDWTDKKDAILVAVDHAPAGAEDDGNKVFQHDEQTE